MILLIETTTSVCSVALAQDGRLLEKLSNLQMNHAELLAEMVKKILKCNHINAKQLEAIAISSGPGSYTGLRIGTSLAKGICFSLSIPLIAVDTLKSMAISVAKRNEWADNTLFCPMIDARRMEVYTALFDMQHQAVIKTDAVVISNDFLHDYQKTPVVYFGDGAQKCQEVLSVPNFTYFSEYKTSAANLISEAQQRFDNKKFEDVAYFEPYYFKEFKAIKAKNKVISSL